MNTQSRPTTNAHFTAQHRYQIKSDLSDQLAHFQTYNFELTKERDLSRYRTAYSSKLNIFDNSRTVSPNNYFGHKFIRNVDRTQLFNPAGMDGENSRTMTDQPFTKPVPKSFPQVL